MESEAVKHLDVAIRKCDDLKRMLFLSLLHVQILSNKYDREWHETQIENMTVNQTASETVIKTDPAKLPRIRSVQSIQNSNNILIVQLIKVQRSIEVILTKLDFLLNRYGRKNTFAVKYLKRRVLQPVQPPDSRKHSRHRNCF